MVPILERHGHGSRINWFDCTFIPYSRLHASPTSSIVKNLFVCCCFFSDSSGTKVCNADSEVEPVTTGRGRFCRKRLSFRVKRLLEGCSSRFSSTRTHEKGWAAHQPVGNDERAAWNLLAPPSWSTHSRATTMSSRKKNTVFLFF